MTQVAFEQVMLCLGLAGLWVLWYHFLRPQRVDIFRQKLFELRSDLFDLAASGVLPFDHPAYTQLRLLINGLIRFAHRASFPTLVVATVQSKKAPSDTLGRWRRCVEQLPEESRGRLLKIQEEVSEVFIGHIISGSVTLSIFVVLRFAVSLSEALFQLIVGRRDIGNFTVVKARRKIEIERNQVAGTGARVIEARVLYEEQRRIRRMSKAASSEKPNHAYAQ